MFIWKLVIKMNTKYYTTQKKEPFIKKNAGTSGKNCQNEPALSLWKARMKYRTRRYVADVIEYK